MAYAALTERTVKMSRQKIYAHLMDFGGLKKLLPDDVESVSLQGQGVGAVRTVQLVGVEGKVQERLDGAIDGLVMSYSIINDTKLPLDRYHAVVELADAPGGGCKIRWGSNWIARGAPETEVKGLLEGLYGKLIDGMVKLG